MRRFSAAYLDRSRETLWQDEPRALKALSLADREAVVEVGAGTGQFTAVLDGHSDADLYAVDIDRDHLTQAAQHAEVLLGDATALPVAPDAADLVVCQTLLTNLPTPGVAVGEFERVSRGLVGAIEPDNSAVTIESTAADEAAVAERVRAAYLAGTPVSPTIGARAEELFTAQGLTVRSHRRHEYTRVIEPPYTDRALAIAKEQATGTMITDNRPVFRAAGITEAEYESLQAATRAVGREIVAQMQAGDYRRRETVSLYVTVGAVGSAKIGDGQSYKRDGT